MKNRKDIKTFFKMQYKGAKYPIYKTSRDPNRLTFLKYEDQHTNFRSDCISVISTFGIWRYYWKNNILIENYLGWQKKNS